MFSVNTMKLPFLQDHLSNKVIVPFPHVSQLIVNPTWNDPRKEDMKLLLMFRQNETQNNH